MQNNTIYLDDCEVGQKNAWEFYYEQPENTSLSDIGKIKRVIYSNCSHYWFGYLRYKLYKLSPVQMQEQFRKYIRKNEKTQRYIDSERSRVMDSGDKILGVVARGTDYKILMPHGHARQPETGRVIEKCKEVMREHGCSKVFLATEDQSILDEFAGAFGSKLIYPKALRFYGEEGKYVGQYQTSRENDRYLRGLEYLTTLELLADCDCFVGTGCAATLYRTYRRPEREYEYVFDEGAY